MKTIKLVATGDLMLQRRLQQLPTLNRPEVQAALGTLLAADLAIVNLEEPLSSRGVATEKWAALRGNPEIVEDVLKIGTGVAVIANNHMADYGHDPVHDTVSILDKAGIAHCGAGANLAAALAPAVCERGGWKIGVIGLASTLPLGSAATHDRPGVAPVRVTATYEIDPRLGSEQPGMAPQTHTFVDPTDLGRVVEAIKAARKEVDYLMVSIHWGVPTFWMTAYSGIIAEYQRPLAQAMLDAGADLIHGHHPHVPHGIELYKGKPICYSLGNFLFETPNPEFMSPVAFIVEVVLAEGRGPETFIRPIWVNVDGLPCVPNDQQLAEIKATLSKLSRPLGVDYVPAEDGLLRPVECEKPKPFAASWMPDNQY